MSNVIPSVALSGHLAGFIRLTCSLSLASQTLFSWDASLKFDDLRTAMELV